MTKRGAFLAKLNCKSMAKVGSVTLFSVLFILFFILVVLPLISTAKENLTATTKEKLNFSKTSQKEESLPTNPQNKSAGNRQKKEQNKTKPLFEKNKTKAAQPQNDSIELQKKNETTKNLEKNSTKKIPQENKTFQVPNKTKISAPITGKPIKILPDENKTESIQTKIINALLTIFDSIKKDIFKITAQLVTENGTPIPNQSLFFYLNDSLLGSNQTDESGTASYSTAINELGFQKIGIEFRGNQKFLPSKTEFFKNFSKKTNQSLPYQDKINQTNQSLETNKTNFTIPEPINQINITIPINETNTTFPINLSNQTNQSLLNQTNLTLLNETNLTIPQNISSNISLIQLPAEIGKPVRWIKKIKFSNQTKSAEVEVPEESFNFTVKRKLKEKEEILDKKKIEVIEKGQKKSLEEYEFEKSKKSKAKKILSKNISSNKSKSSKSVQNKTLLRINQSAEELVIEYETEAPHAFEKDFGRIKQVIVNSSLHYKNVKVYTNISEITNRPESIKLFWVQGSGRSLFKNVTYLDTNNNGLIDRLEWTAPHLSNQVFEIIIITKAEHLNSSRGFVSDIFAEVSAKDQNFSETIPVSHFVRVSFEKNLTNGNDITIYAKGNASVEVYLKDSNTKIADFGQISAYKKYSVTLSGLKSPKDTFDLKITGSQNSSVSFDYIVDPTAGYNIYWARGLDEVMFIEGADQYIYSSNNDFTGSAKVDIKNKPPLLGEHLLATIYSNYTYSSPMVISGTICVGLADAKTSKWKDLSVHDWKFLVYDYDPSTSTSTLINETGYIQILNGESTNYVTLSQPYLIDTGHRLKFVLKYNASGFFGTGKEEISLKWADYKAGNPNANWNPPAACGGGTYTSLYTKQTGVGFLINETFDTTPPTNTAFTLSVATGANVTRGEVVNASSSWTDNIGVTGGKTEHQGNGSFTNYTTSFSDPWLNYSLNTSNQTEFSNLGLVNISMWAKDGSNNWGHTSYKHFYLWGSSNLTGFDSNATEINYSESVFLNCSVKDIDLNSPISGYNISFYSNITGFLGSALTNSNGTANITYTFNDVGLHSISCNISNQSDIYYFANNVNSLSKTLNVVDLVAPNITLVAPENQSYQNSSDIVFYFNVSDASDIANCTLDLDSGAIRQLNQSAVNKSKTNNITLTGLSDAEHTWFVECPDIHSNNGFSSNFTFTVDTIPPTANYTSPTPANNSYVGTANIKVNVTHTEANPDKILLYVDGTLNQSQTYASGTNKSTVFSLSFQDGTHNFSVSLNDSAGHLISLPTRIFTVDTGAPTIDYIAPTPANNTNQTQNSFVINVTHTESNPDTIIFYLNNQPNHTSSYSGLYSNLSLSNLGEGTYTYYVWLNDSTGFTNQTEKRTITIDYSAPSLEIIGPENQSYDSDRQVSFQYQTTDNIMGLANCSLYLDGSLNQTNTSVQEGVTQSFTLNLSNGAHTWNISCIDLLGNTNTSSTRTVTADDTFPQISSEAISNSSFLVNEYICLNATITDTFSGVNRVIAQVTKPVSGPVNYTMSNSTGICGNSGGSTYAAKVLNDEAGNYSWTITYATDKAGNQNSSTISPSLNWSVTSVIFLNVTMTEPLTPFEINESDQSTNYTYNQSCQVVCRDDSQGSCDNTYLFVQFNNGTWNDASTTDQNLITNMDNYSCGSLAPNSWWNTSWNNRFEINFTYSGSTTLSNFPFYANVSYLSGMQPDYDDIRFISGRCGSNGAELNYELENYTSSNADFWVQIPSVKSGTNYFCVYYNNSAATSTENPTAVWDSNYVSVYHLDHTAGNAIDTIGNFNAEEFFTPDSNMNVSGVVGRGDYFDGSDYLGTNPEWNVDGAHTYCTWVKWTALHDGTILEDGGKVDGHALVLTAAGKIRYAEYFNGAQNWLDSTNTYNDGNWHYVCGGHTGTVQFLYIDGVLDQQATQGDGFVGGNNARIGSTNGATAGFADNAAHYLNATIDELRVSSSARSAEWINLSYQIIANRNSVVGVSAPQSQSTASAQVCNATFQVTTGLNSGGNLWPVRCTATSTTASIDYSNQTNMTINDHPHANFTYPSNASWLTSTETLNGSASTDDQGISIYSFEIDSDPSFSSPST
ncbi:DUF2341 domain-containing protein, partial [Candidatus Pacearchaeota archaeon]